MKMALNRVLPVTILVACLATHARSGPQAFALVLGGVQKIVKPGSEVRVDVTLQNSSDRAIEVVDSVAGMEFQYVLDVRDSQGKVPPETDLARKVRERGYYSSDSVL